MSQAQIEENDVEQRIAYGTAASGAMKAMLGLEGYIRECGLEHGLIHLVKMRASQINGCAYCLDMHSREARAEGETEQRLYVLSAWREAPDLYTPRERAAFAWTEALTLISTEGAPDETYNEARKHFSEKELVDLTMVIVTINGWNRLAIGFHTPIPGVKSK